MNVLLDLNFLLDVVLARAPWSADATQLSDRIATGAARGLVAAHSLPTLFYLCRKSRDIAAAFAAVDQCVASFEIVPLNTNTLLLARTYPGNDLEDNLQIAAAVQAGASFIATRDLTGFKHSPIQPLSVSEILRRL
jgi:predicted nucleic acid-binding protein